MTALLTKKIVYACNHNIRNDIWSCVEVQSWVHHVILRSLVTNLVTKIQADAELLWGFTTCHAITQADAVRCRVRWQHQHQNWHLV